MHISVIGTGHVGLLTAVSMAAIGHDVVAEDIDHEKMEILQLGRAPFFEPGLDVLLDEAIRSGKLRFSTDVEDATQGADVVFICVGTPAGANGEANLVAVEKATQEVIRHVRPGTVLVEKSTVPAGTAARIERVIAMERPDIAAELYVVSNPEFLREGRAVQDCLEPDRILVGAGSRRAFNVMRRVYQPLLDKNVALIETNISTSELSKHACNAFLALKISYANAMARICERAGADVEAVAEIMGSDPRIGQDFLKAGLGWGGYCFPKDLTAFRLLASRLGYDFPLLAEVERINSEAVDVAIEKLRSCVWNLEGKRIALLGLSFKAGTDDVRFSPALVLARRMIEEGAVVIGYDPEARNNALKELTSLKVATNPYDAARGAHCIVIATDWPEFRDLDLAKLRELATYPMMVDARNLLDPLEAKKAGFHYDSMGRSAPS